jgi:hypothetical protein
VAFLITGLTPGSSHTYKWGFSVDNASVEGRLFAGGTNGLPVMEVIAA